MAATQEEPHDWKWLLYLLPAVVVITIVGLSLIYAQFVKPHLRPHWLGPK